MLTDKLKEVRESTGLNKKDFANHIGVKYTTYNGYETGAREPGSDFLMLISTKFDVSIDYLLGLNQNKEILHSYKIKSAEYEHIKKYRDLDDHGKEMVDFTLSKEYDRSIALKKQAEIITLREKTPDHLTVVAAHERTDKEITPEDIKHDDDIMNDPNF